MTARGRTLYYSANVYSEARAGFRNGIPFFNDPWKNIVCTLYHELIEFQTDPDVAEANRQNDRRFLGWTSDNRHEIGDQPMAANRMDKVFVEVMTNPGPKATPVQLMYSNLVHGAEMPDEMSDNIPSNELEIDGPGVQGEIGEADERDRYSFSVTAPGTYAIETSGPTDTFMSLFGPDNDTTLIEEDDDDGLGRLSLVKRVLVAGKYFVKVRHWSDRSTGPYGISVKSVNVSGPAQLQVDGPEIQGDIGEEEESDFYSFNVTASGDHTIETSGSKDTVLTLLGPNSDTNLIAENDDHAGTLQSNIQRSLAAGVYFVRVRLFSSTAKGGYGVKVRRG